MKKQKTEAQLSMQVYNFNKQYSVGDRVKLKTDEGDTIVVTVKSEATILGGHSVVGWFNEVSGCVSLDNVLN